MRFLTKLLVASLAIVSAGETLHGQSVLKNISRARRLAQHPYAMRTVGTVTYFSANTRNRWSFWRTDGTESGTVELEPDLLHNLRADTRQPYDAQWGDRYFFVGNGRPRVVASTWSTVREIRGPSNVQLAARDMIVVGNTLYFVASDGTSGFELWSMPTTGTTARLFLDIRPGSASAFTTDWNWLEPFGGRFFFVADDGVNGRELWNSNATVSGTRMVADLTPGSASSTIRDVEAASNGRLFFTTAPSTGSGRELWTTTSLGATPTRVSPIVFSFIDSLTNFSNGVLFRGNADGKGAEFWRSDGTAATTRIVADFAPGSLSGVSRLLGGSNFLYFAGSPSGGPPVLCRTNGTAAGTIALDGSNPLAFAALQSGAFGGGIFMATDAAGTEPWITDGTVAGTQRLIDLNPGAGSSFQPPSSYQFRFGLMERLGTKTIFFAQSDETLPNLFITDGTANGTELLADVIRLSDGDSVPQPLGAVGNGEVAFTASDGQNGTELWISDGTRTNTRMIELTPGTTGSSLTRLGSAGGRVVFSHRTTAEGVEPWVSDGTLQGTRLLLDIRPGSQSSAPIAIASINGSLLFAAQQGTARSLWITDGTTAGTRQLSTVSPNFGGGLFTAELQGRVLFPARDPRIGDELWITDGTTQGTKLVADLNPFGQDSNVSYLAATPTQVYFRALGRVTPGTVLTRLWRTDGTPEGTRIVYDGSPLSVATLGEDVIFSAPFVNTGTELLRSDGTPNGTTLVKDVFPGTSSSQPRSLTSLGSRVLFHAVGSGSGREPWTTDGTEAGTRLLGDLWPGVGSSDPSDFFVVGNRAFFTALVETNNRQLFATDGVTVTRVDINPKGTANASGFLRFGDRIFFSANHPTMGQEPWTMSATDFGAGFTEGFGTACGGSLGFASLTSIGAPAPLDGFGLDLWHGYPNAPAAMLLGRSRTAIPFGSCTLLTSPLHAAPLLTNSLGRARLEVPIQAGLAGQDWFAQSVVADPRLPSVDSLAFTRGLRIHVGR